jgi:hypothetical protein
MNKGRYGVAIFVTILIIILGIYIVRSPGIQEWGNISVQLIKIKDIIILIFIFCILRFIWK